MATYRDLNLPPCPCYRCDGDPDSQVRGRPKPGSDECLPRGNNPGCPHGHDFDDGMCMNCGVIDGVVEGRRMRDMFDHYDGCAYWVGDVCDCLLGSEIEEG